MKLTKASDDLKRIGWSWNYQQMQEIKAAVENKTGEQVSLEQIDALLTHLDACDSLCFRGCPRDGIRGCKDKEASNG